MTPERLRECLTLLRWSQRGLADALGVHQTTARRWTTGEGTVPANVAQWLEDLTAAHEAQPLPVGWGRVAA